MRLILFYATIISGFLSGFFGEEIEPFKPVLQMVFYGGLAVAAVRWMWKN